MDFLCHFLTVIPKFSVRSDAFDLRLRLRNMRHFVLLKRTATNGWPSNGGVRRRAEFPRFPLPVCISDSSTVSGFLFGHVICDLSTRTGW